MYIENSGKLTLNSGVSLQRGEASQMSFDFQISSKSTTRNSIVRLIYQILWIEWILADHQVSELVVARSGIGGAPPSGLCTLQRKIVCQVEDYLFI